MQYNITSPRPLLKQIHITADSDEVANFFDLAATHVAGGLTLDGFRKGTVPSALTEVKKIEEVREQAEKILIEDFLHAILKREQFMPLHQVVLEKEKADRGKNFSFSANVEILPDIPLPVNLESLSIRIREPEPDGADLAHVANHYLKRLSSLEEITEIRHPQCGDVVRIDVEASCEGRLVPTMCYKDFRYRLLYPEAEKYAQDIDPVILSLQPGQKGTTHMHCPADYPDVEYKGKSITLSLMLHAIYAEKQPVIDDEFAKRMGFKNLGDFKLHLYQKARAEKLHALDAEAKAQILNTILDPLDFPIPECLVTRYLKTHLRAAAAYMEDQSLQRETILQNLQHLKESALEEARNDAKQHAFLLALALREGMHVTEEDTNKVLKNMALAGGQDTDALAGQLQASGEIHEIQEGILINKALALLCNKAQRIFLDENGSPLKGQVKTAVQKIS